MPEAISNKERDRQEQIKRQRELLEKNLPPVITRADVKKYTGYSPCTLRNEDSLGTGVKDPIRSGKKVSYHRENLIDWIIKKQFPDQLY